MAFCRRDRISQLKKGGKNGESGRDGYVSGRTLEAQRNIGGMIQRIRQKNLIRMMRNG